MGQNFTTLFEKPPKDPSILVYAILAGEQRRHLNNRQRHAIVKDNQAPPVGLPVLDRELPPTNSLALVGPWGFSAFASPDLRNER